MMQDKVVVTNGLKAEMSVPGDKSITHRAIMFASIALGNSVIRTNILGRDNFATIRIFQQLGVDIQLSLNELMFRLAKLERIENVNKSNNEVCEIKIVGKGLEGLMQPSSSLDCGNSGTTARLLCGLFSALPFSVTLVGDSSLSKRPFARVTEPLSKMGAKFSGNSLPLTIGGSDLQGISWEITKASAQVKSALMLAGLFARGKTVVIEPLKSRDHTENMLSAMGAKISSDLREGKIITEIEKLSHTLSPVNMSVPGDISAAMFFIVAATLDSKSSKICIKRVGINPTRKHCLDILKKMGASIKLDNERLEQGELVADIYVEKSELKGINLEKSDVALAIDEIPIIAVAASFAKGKTTISGAEELRVKESDRISMIVALLKSFGVNVKELEDGLEIDSLPTSNICIGDDTWKACGDHRISMCGAIMEYLLGGPMIVRDQEAIETSFPSFFDCFNVN